MCKKWFNGLEWLKVSRGLGQEFKEWVQCSMWYMMVGVGACCNLMKMLLRVPGRECRVRLMECRYLFPPLTTVRWFCHNIRHPQTHTHVKYGHKDTFCLPHTALYIQKINWISMVTRPEYLFTSLPHWRNCWELVLPHVNTVFAFMPTVHIWAPRHL